VDCQDPCVHIEFDDPGYVTRFYSGGTKVLAAKRKTNGVPINTSNSLCRYCNSIEKGKDSRMC
jgi:hypothetical protein